MLYLTMSKRTAVAKILRTETVLLITTLAIDFLG